MRFLLTMQGDVPLPDEPVADGTPAQLALSAEASAGLAASGSEPEQAVTVDDPEEIVDPFKMHGIAPT